MASFSRVEHCVASSIKIGWRLVQIEVAFFIQLIDLADVRNVLACDVLGLFLEIRKRLRSLLVEVG